MQRESHPQDGEGRVTSYADHALKALLTDRPIAYHPMLARAVGSVTGGIFLSQLLYWTPRGHDPDGWIRKTQEEITAETALTRREQETARRDCERAGILTWTLRGIPARLHYRVDISQLAKSIAALPPDPLAREEADRDRPQEGSAVLSGRPGPARKQDRRNAPTKFGGMRQTGLHESAKQDRTDPPSSDGGSRQAISESRSEIRTESDDVVIALRARGISDSIAERLARTHAADYILAKCELVDWLVETKHRAVAKNAAGYLRRAIEDDYRPPPEYRSRAEWEAEAAARAAAKAVEEQELREQAEEERRARELDIAAVAALYPPRPIPGTALTTQEAWDRVLASLAEMLSRPAFETFLSRTLLLRCDGRAAEVGARSAFEVDYLTGKLDHHITQSLSAVLGQPVRCSYVSLTNLVDRDSSLAAAGAGVSVGGRP
jgi:hypothetical protein